MQLSLSASVCPGLRLPEFLDLAKQAGFPGVELWRTDSQSSPVHPDFSVCMVRDHFQRAGLRLTGLNIRDLTGRKADSDERNLGYNLRQVEWDIHLARALGLRAVNLRGGARTAEALEDLIGGVQQLLKRIPEITLNLASRPGSCLQGLADYQAMIPCVDPRARLLLDTGELLAAGEDPLQVARAFARRLGLVHLRDQQGAQPISFAALFGLLKETGYEGVLVIELAPAEDPLSAAIAARQQVVQSWDSAAGLRK